MSDCCCSLNAGSCDCYDEGFRDGQRLNNREPSVVYATIKSPEAAYQEWRAAEKERKRLASLRVGLMRFTR